MMSSNVSHNSHPPTIDNLEATALRLSQARDCDNGDIQVNAADTDTDPVANLNAEPAPPPVPQVAPPRVAINPPTAARDPNNRRGRTNYTVREIMHLLRIIDRIVPIVR